MAPREKATRREGSRRSGRPTLTELTERLAAVEARLARVEDGRPPPGDGRTTPGPVRRVRPRCPGCGLDRQVRNGRCRWCGRPA